MTRKLNVTTLWTANCNVGKICPGVHNLDDRPDLHYVISRQVLDPAEIAAYETNTGRVLAPGEVLGAVPPQMSADGYMVTTLVTDPDDYAALAPLMGPGEVLGMIPAGTWTLQEVRT